MSSIGPAGIEWAFLAPKGLFLLRKVSGFKRAVFISKSLYFSKVNFVSKPALEARLALSGPDGNLLTAKRPFSTPKVSF